MFKKGFVAPSLLDPDTVAGAHRDVIAGEFQVDSDRYVKLTFVVLHRIFEKFVCDVSYGVLDLSLPVTTGGSVALCRKERGYVVSEEICRQPVIAPTGSQRRTQGRECERQVFAFP